MNKTGLIMLAVFFGVGVLLLFTGILGVGSVTGSPSAIVQLLAQAIAAAEGFGVAGAIPTLANNPGDITQAGQNFPGDTGQTMGSAKIIVFDTVQDGWNALYVQVGNMLSGNDTLYPSTLTLEQAGLQYSGGSSAWVANVAAALGVDPSTTLGQLSGSSS
jgi:hypothetical protein